MKRSSFYRTLIVAAAVAVSSLATAQVANPAETKQLPFSEVKAQVLQSVSRIISTNAFVPGVDLAKWDEFIKSQQEAIDKANTDAEFAEAVRAAMSKFGISHMVLITPQAARARVERRAVGIGINIQPQDDGILVTNVFPESPAAEAGLQPGDLIVEANGKPITAQTSLTGDEGTTVEIKVKRPNGKVDAMKLTRRKFNNVRPDTLTWVNDETAVLKVHTFDLAYDRKKIDEHMKAARKAKNLVLDLRSNGGGAVVNMLHLLGYFVPMDEPFGIFINKAMVKRFVDTTGGSPTELRKIAMSQQSGWLRPLRAEGGMFAGNVAVLINGGSGSASEITAQAIKELRDAPVVGSKSAGAVLVSTMAQVTNGWMLQFPLSDYMSAQGVRLEGNGIVPDIDAAMPRFGEPDTAVEKALALLKRAELRNQRAGGSVPPPARP